MNFTYPNVSFSAWASVVADLCSDRIRWDFCCKSDNPCLFTVLNKNTSEIYYEFIPFNKALAQEISDKAVTILEATKANEVLPRIAQSRDYFACKYCEFQDTCWSN